MAHSIAQGGIQQPTTSKNIQHCTLSPKGGIVWVSGLAHAPQLPPTHHPQEGHGQVVDLLLKAGADRDKATNDGATPLFIASEVCCVL